MRAGRQGKRVGATLARAALVVGVAVGTAAAAMEVFRSPPGPAFEQLAEPEIAIPSPDPPTPSFAPPSPTPSPRRTAAARVSPSPSPSPSPSKKPVPPAGPDLSSFRGLATWFDNYDYASVDPSAAAAAMRARGVRALYLQTGRYTLPSDFKDVAEMSAWIRAAHANGMKIVGWYLPGYGDMARDVRRTVAIASFRTGDGQRFDGLGIDIEDKCEMAGSTCKGVKPSPSLDQAGWNAAIVTHISRVRAAVGRTFPMAGIVPPPLGMAIRPSHWAGFPWRSLPGVVDVVIPMAYWSYRTDCPSVPDHCPYAYGRKNVEQVRALTGSATIPIHAAGGVADSITTREVSDFTRGARDARVIGGSLYDYRTTEASYWAPLAGFN